MALRLGERARGLETPKSITAKPDVTLDKVPVTEAASQKLPKLIPQRF